jgi:hypothetical protein
MRSAAPPLKERAENESPINRAVAVPKVLWRCLFQPPSGGFRFQPTALAVGELTDTISNAIALAFCWPDYRTHKRTKYGYGGGSS